MANSYNVTALPDYVDQHREELIAKAVLSSKSAEMFNLVTGVKSATALNRISTEVVFGDGATCGWNEAGTASLSQRIIEPKALKVNMAICDKNLLSKWAAYLVKVEAGKTDRDLPFEEDFINSVIKSVNAGVEKMIYQGDSAGSGTQFDGLIKILSSSSAVTSTTAASASAYDFLKAVAAKFPAEILDKEDLVILVSMPTYNEYMQNLVSANLYHYDPANGENEYRLPGTNIRVIGVNGLNNAAKDYAIGGSLENFYYGTNLADGKEIFDLWYSKDNREFRLAIEFVAGVQVGWDTEVVLGTRE
jgi:hypothetical protein